MYQQVVAKVKVKSDVCVCSLISSVLFPCVVQVMITVVCT